MALGTRYRVERIVASSAEGVLFPGHDEVLVTHDRAVRGVEVRNTGRDQLVVIKFFGPDVNRDVPMIERRST